MIPFFLFVLLTPLFAFEPSCSNCKFFIPQSTNNDFGMCNRFKNYAYIDNKHSLVNQFAVDCRRNPDLCGDDGHFFIPSDSKLADEYEELQNRCCGEVNETDELEQLEKEMFDVFQKIKKHNKRQIYKTTKDLFKLFKR